MTAKRREYVCMYWLRIQRAIHRWRCRMRFRDREGERSGSLLYRLPGNRGLFSSELRNGFRSPGTEFRSRGGVRRARVDHR